MPLPLSEDRPRLVVTLDDGSEAELTPLLPEDRDLLEEGMRQLSPESRFARFGSGRGELTRSELDYLTRLDQRRHVAWGAIVADSAAGVGRYIVMDDEGCAEIAITVIDRLQRKGLGRSLFQALVAVARADGVGALCFETLPENTAMQRIVRGLPVSLDSGQGLLTGRIKIADLAQSPRDPEFLALIEKVRGGL